MAEIFGLDGKQTDHRILEDDLTDAKVSLRKLLDRMDAGEIKATKWLFIFDEQDTKNIGYETTRVEDSGITVERAIHMVELVKFKWLRSSFEEPV